MNQKDRTLPARMHLATDAVIVNQCGQCGEEAFSFEGHRILWIDSDTRGLSVSRNICLDRATGDICLLADDDLIYEDGYGQLVAEAFAANPDSDILRFQAEGIERRFKVYPEEGGPVNFMHSLKISSVELAFRRARVGDIRFDELIGAGTDFYMGEENAFLAECLRRGLKITYVPKRLLRLHLGTSSWNHDMNEGYFVSRGAAFTAMGTPWTKLLIWQFAIRKRGTYRKNASMPRAIRWMNRGSRLYRAARREKGKDA